MFNDRFSSPRSIIFEDLVKQTLYKVYAWMTVGLLLTAVTAAVVASNVWLLGVIFSSKIVFYGIIFAQLGIALGFSGVLNSRNWALARGLFIAYAVLLGVTLSAIFLVYNITTIGMVFAITACMFAAMSLYGYTTQANLSVWRSTLFMILFGVIIASVVNIFVGSAMIDFFLSYVCVFIFSALTAYDTNRIKALCSDLYYNYDEDFSQSIALFGAFTLYLDFVNLFISLLRVFGRRRR